MGLYYSLYKLDLETIKSVKHNNDAIESLMEDIEEQANSENNYMDLDKNWAAIHFLLTGTDGEAPPPAGMLFLGTPISEDWGYGPVRTLSALQIHQFSKFLSSLTNDELERRFDFDRMHELKIYPDIWNRHDNADKEWVLESFTKLKNFVKAASKEKKLLMTIIS